MTANRHSLRAIRKRSGIGLRQLSRQTGLNRGFLSQIETGVRGASPETLEKIAVALGVPVEAITFSEPVGRAS